jgi:hypothetical protein
MKPRPLAVDPKSFERSGVLPPRIVLALACGTTAEEKPLPSIAEEPGPVNLFAPYLLDICPTVSFELKKRGRTYVSEG